MWKGCSLPHSIQRTSSDQSQCERCSEEEHCEIEQS